MDSRDSSQSCRPPVPASSHLDALPGGETVVRADGRSSPVPLLDGSSPLQVSLAQEPPTLRLAGDIDEHTYAGLTEALATVAAAGERRIRVDLAGVSYCDIAGLRAIISLAAGRDDGRAAVEHLVLAHLPGSLLTVLQILGWDDVPGLVLEAEA